MIARGFREATAKFSPESLRTHEGGWEHLETNLRRNKMFYRVEFLAKYADGFLLLLDIASTALQAQSVNQL